MLDVLIIVVNWNTKDLLKKCLSSVQENTRRVSYKIAVVDNASIDGSTKMVQNEFPDVVLIQNDTNKGFSSANNQAMGILDCKYYLLLNSDTLVLNDAIDRLVSFAESQKDIGVLSPKLIKADGSTQISWAKFPTIRNSIILHLNLSNFIKLVKTHPVISYDKQDLISALDVDYTSGACMLVRKKAVCQVGQLDESYFFFGEDLDWCFRFNKAGWRVVYYPGIQIIHLANSSGKNKFGGSRLVAERLSKLLFYQKSYGKFYAEMYRIIMIVLSLLKYVLYKFLSLVGLRSKETFDLSLVYHLMLIAFINNLSVRDLQKI